MTARTLIMTLVAALTMTSLAACESAGGGLGLIDDDYEADIGAEVHKDVLAEMPECTTCDPVLVEYVETMGHKIAKASSRSDITYHFTILDTEEVNAFAAPGGYVYVTTGLLREMDETAELAGVIAHEVGHIAARHGIEDLEVQVGTSLVAELLLGSDSAAGDIAELLVSGYQGFVHNKDQEYEADKLGVQFSAAAGYNPYGLVHFFEYLEDLTAVDDPTGITDAIGNVLSTHPPTDKRIAEALDEIQALGITETSSGYVLDDPAQPFSTIAALVP